MKVKKNETRLAVLDPDGECVVVSLFAQSLQFDQSQLAAVTQENESLRKQVEQMEGEAKK